MALRDRCRTRQLPRRHHHCTGRAGSAHRRARRRGADRDGHRQRHRPFGARRRGRGASRRSRCRVRLLRRARGAHRRNRAAPGGRVGLARGHGRLRERAEPAARRHRPAAARGRGNDPAGARGGIERRAAGGAVQGPRRALRGLCRAERRRALCRTGQHHRGQRRLGALRVVRTGRRRRSDSGRAHRGLPAGGA